MQLFVTALSRDQQAGCRMITDGARALGFRDHAALGLISAPLLRNTTWHFCIMFDGACGNEFVKRAQPDRRHRGLSGLDPPLQRRARNIQNITSALSIPVGWSSNPHEMAQLIYRGTLTFGTTGATHCAGGIDMDHWYSFGSIIGHADGRVAWKSKRHHQPLNQLLVHWLVNIETRLSPTGA